MSEIKYVIPTSSIPDQRIRVVLDGQACVIRLKQRIHGGLYFSLISDGQTIVTNVQVQPNTTLLCRGYTGFRGDVCILPMTAEAKPTYSRLGTDFLLVYMPAQKKSYDFGLRSQDLLG